METEMNNYYFMLKTTPNSQNFRLFKETITKEYLKLHHKILIWLALKGL